MTQQWAPNHLLSVGQKLVPFLIWTSPASTPWLLQFTQLRCNSPTMLPNTVLLLAPCPALYVTEQLVIELAEAKRYIFGMEGTLRKVRSRPPSQLMGQKTPEIPVTSFSSLFSNV